MRDGDNLKDFKRKRWGVHGGLGERLAGTAFPNSGSASTELSAELPLNIISDRPEGQSTLSFNL
jgi:hypothetical protein